MNDQREEGDRLPGAPHPRGATRLVGHAEAEAAVLAAWRAGQVPHAILIGGDEGIGKATFAYRVAKFVLAQGGGIARPEADSLDVPGGHPVAQQVAAGSHPDLHALRRLLTGDRKRLPEAIPVDEVRKAVGFVGMTAASGGWRVVIVDSVDELNMQGANALLKSVEEPPPRTLFLLVAHRPGRVLPTIRSRCRRIALRPLADDEVRAVLASIGTEAEPAALEAAIAGAAGSVARALSLLRSDTADLRATTLRLLDRAAAPDWEAIHALADRVVAGAEPGFEAFVGAVEDWLAAPLDRPAAGRARLAAHAEVWEKIARAGIEVDAFNLDRKPFVFSVFSLIAEASRRAG